MIKKLALPASVVTVAVGTAALVAGPANAQYGPYAPAPPKPVTTVNAGLKDIAGDLQALRASRRTGFKVTLDAAAPGAYSVIVYRRGTATKLITGSRTLKGTTVKPAKIELDITRAGIAYFDRLKRAGASTVRADLRLSFNPTAPGATTVRRRVVTIGL